MVKIEVQLYAFLRQYLPEGTDGFTVRMELSRPMSVSEVLGKELSVPERVLESVTVLMVNGSPAEPDRVLQDGDVLAVLPLVAGG